MFAFLKPFFCFLNNMLISYNIINKLFPSNEDVEGNGDRQCEINYRNIILRTRRQNYQTKWGPKGFKKETHPLAIMVCLL